MPTNTKIDTFLSRYDEVIFTRALKLREVILACLPNIIEEVDLPAKMVAYSYGKKYVDLICTLIPSKKGLKLGFLKGMNFLIQADCWKGPEKFHVMWSFILTNKSSLGRSKNCLRMV